MATEDKISFDTIVKGAFIKESISILHNAYISKKLVLFVGAGADFASGIPLWKNAIEQFCQHLNIPSNGADPLKIPQIYHNSRGKKEYVELCRKIFCYGEELPINELHSKIVDLNVNTIITTNYTDFLEREMKNRGHIYKTVCQDRDLPYTKNEKLIIKMHGDFEHDNFVLKEDDYLAYNRNFRLIETYIKAVLAKNVVLFLGYSFNDPDIKQIFSWVKDILGDDFQQAYMVESYQDYDENMFEYFRNLGTNVIYTKLFSDNSQEAQLRLLDMIKSGIQKKQSGAEEARELKELFRVYLKSILGSAAAPDQGNTDGSMPAGNIHASAANIGNFELFLMIKYLSEKDIQNIVSQCNVSFLPAQDGCCSYLREVLKNLREKKSQKYDRELWNCLTLISYMELEPNLAEDAVDCISRKFNYFSYRSHNGTIRRLLSNCCKNKWMKQKQEGAFEPDAYALGRFLRRAIQQAEAADASGMMAYNNIVPLLAYCCHDLYGETFDGNISGILHTGKALLLAKMYSFCSDTNKKKITEYFLKRLKNADWTFYDTYGEAVLNGAIDPEPDFEQIIYDTLDTIKEMSQGCSPNPYKNVLITMCNLYGNNKITDTVRLKNILQESDDAKLIFLSDMDNFDYSQFDINWLDVFSDGLLADIATNKTAKTKICRKFAEETENNPVSAALMKKFIRHFV